MSDLSQKTTIYLNPQVKKFIQHKAIAEDTSVSEIINSYFADILEDLEDLKKLEKRRGEPTVSFEEVLNDLGLTYDDLQDSVREKRTKRAS
jgi:hypothetical protein